MTLVDFGFLRTAMAQIFKADALEHGFRDGLIGCREDDDEDRSPSWHVIVEIGNEVYLALLDFDNALARAIVSCRHALCKFFRRSDRSPILQWVRAPER